MSDDSIWIVDLEQHPESCIGVAPRDKRERLTVGMFARVVFTNGKRRERLWIKIMDIQPTGFLYKGELVNDSYFDVEIGDMYEFGPEHVCEWSPYYP